MKIPPNSVIAFKEEYFHGNPKLAKFLVTRLKVGEQNMGGVHAKHYKEVCKILAVPQNKVTYKRTQYDGVYMANIKAPIIKLSPTLNKNKRQVMREKYMELTGGPRIVRVKKLQQLIYEQGERINEIQSDLVKQLREFEEKILSISQFVIVIKKR